MKNYVKFIGTGAALPSMVSTIQTLGEIHGPDRAQKAQSTGVLKRYYCSTETQIDLACIAVQQAVESAEIKAADIDLVISACAIPYQTLPSTAPLVMSRIGLTDGSAAAFDVNSTCLSFLTGLDIAARMLQSGQHKTAVVFSAEVASRALPWENDPETAALFGDGAAAVVLQSHDDGSLGLCANLMRTYPSAYDACTIGAGGTRFDFHNEPAEFAKHALFQMDGKELFRISSRHFKHFLMELLDNAGWTKDDVDIVIPHQASPAGLEHMIRQVGIDASKIVNIAADYGNQIAASIPFAFDLARREGRIPAGSKVLFLGTSAGVSIGGMAWGT